MDDKNINSKICNNTEKKKIADHTIHKPCTNR